MDLLAYFPDGMKAGDELSYFWSENDYHLMKIVTVVLAESWHISLKSTDFAFDLSTAKNVASIAIPCRIRAGVTTLYSENAKGEIATGKLIVQGRFAPIEGRGIHLKTGFVLSRDAGQPSTSTLVLGGGFGDYTDQPLVFKLEG